MAAAVAAGRQPLRAAHPSGRYVEFNFKPLEDGSLLGFYRDITELKEREEALALAKRSREQGDDASSAPQAN